MNAISDARTELATALGTDDWPCHAVVPEAIEPACFVVEPSDPFVELEGVTYGGGREVSVAYRVYVFPRARSNDEATKELDLMLTHLIDHLPDGWGIDRIAKPDGLQTANWIAYGLPVTVSKFITL